MKNVLQDIIKALETLDRPAGQGEDGGYPTTEIRLSDAGDYAVQSLKAIASDPKRFAAELSPLREQLAELTELVKQSPQFEALQTRTARVRVFTEPGLTSAPRVEREISVSTGGQPSAGRTAVFRRDPAVAEAIASLAHAIERMNKTSAGDEEPSSANDEDTEPTVVNTPPAKAAAESTEPASDKAKEDEAKEAEQSKGDEEQTASEDVEKATDPGWHLDMNASMPGAEEITKQDATKDWGADPDTVAASA